MSDFFKNLEVSTEFSNTLDKAYKKIFNANIVEEEQYEYWEITMEKLTETYYHLFIKNK